MKPGTITELTMSGAFAFLLQRQGGHNKNLPLLGKQEGNGDNSSDKKDGNTPATQAKPQPKRP